MTNQGYARNLPAWSGTTFTSKFHSSVPSNLEPSKQTLPSGFVAIITGASRGIGRATAQAFASAGATGLILTGRSTKDLEATRESCYAVPTKSQNLKITLLTADLALESSALEVVETVKREYGGLLDLLVNNAAIYATDDSAFEKVGDVRSDQVEGPINANYLGRFYLVKHLLPLLLSGPGQAKTIVNISSIGSHTFGPFGYAISALVTNRLTQMIGEQYADQGILSFAVHPGIVLTDDHRSRPVLAERVKNVASDSEFLCGAFLLWLIKEKREWLSGRYLDATWDVEELESKKQEILDGDKLKMRLVV